MSTLSNTRSQIIAAKVNELGAKCRQCRLASADMKPYRCAFTNAYDNVEAEIVVVVDMPSRGDINSGELMSPFTDPGMLFAATLKELGIEGTNVAVIPATICSPPPASKVDKVWTDTVDACNNVFNRSLAKFKKVKVIIALGNWAMYALGYPHNGSYSIGNLSGWLDYNTTHKAFVMASYPLTSVYRNTELFPEVEWVFTKAKELLTRSPGVFRNRPDLDLRIAGTAKEAVDMIRYVRDFAIEHSKGLIAGDLETSAIEWYDGYILAMGLSSGEINVDDQPVIYIVPDTILYMKTVKNCLIQVFRDERLKWLWHHGKFDTEWLTAALSEHVIDEDTGIRKFNVQVPIDLDTMYMHYALDERKGTHSLETLSQKYCEADRYDIELKKYLPNKKTSYAVVPRPVLYKYLGYDCYYLFDLYHELLDILNNDAGPYTDGYPELLELIDNILIPAANYWRRTEMRGVRIDVDYLAKLNDLMEVELAEIKAECIESVRVLTGVCIEGINLNSSKQVCEVIYDILKLKSKGKRTSAKKFLENNSSHPFCAALLKYRSSSKILSTYVKGFSARVFNGVIYGTLLIHGTVTGRLSSRRPNWQNVPRGSIFKRVVIPFLRHVLYQSDYSNLEVRTAAYYSRDPLLIKALKGDIHWEVAEGVFPEEIAFANSNDTIKYLEELVYSTPVLAEIRIKHQMKKFNDVALFRKLILKQLRHMTKYITFGILYGRGAKDLAENELQCPVADAVLYINNFFKKFHVLKAWIDEVHNDAITHGSTEMPSGRRRRYPIFLSKWDAWAAHRQSVNAKCQSLASDINMIACMETEKILKGGLGYTNFAVHDSQVGGLCIERIVEAVTVVDETMQSAFVDDEIAFPVDIQLGPNWHDVKDVKKINGVWQIIHDEDTEDYEELSPASTYRLMSGIR